MTTSDSGPPEMTKLPFGKDIAPDEIFTYDQLEELKRIVSLAIQHRSPAVITGQAGVGKTLGVGAAVSELPTNKYSVVYLGYDQDGSTLLKRLACGLGLQPKRLRAHTWLQIGQHLSDNLTEQAKTPVVVIDEAHQIASAWPADWVSSRSAFVPTPGCRSGSICPITSLSKRRPQLL